MPASARDARLHGIKPPYRRLNAVLIGANRHFIKRPCTRPGTSILLASKINAIGRAGSAEIHRVGVITKPLKRAPNRPPLRVIRTALATSSAVCRRVISEAARYVSVDQMTGLA